MSAAPPQAIIKPLPAPYRELSRAALAFGQHRDTGILAHGIAAPPDHQTDDFPTDALSSSFVALHPESLPTSPFDFEPLFAFQDLPRERPGAPLSEDHAPRLSPPLLLQSVPFPSLLPDLLRHQAVHGLGTGSTESSRGRSSMDGSDGESPGSYPPLQSLDDPVPDEFGLINNKFHNGVGVTAGLGSKPKEDRSDHAPAWSELKTKAGKERKRLPLACIACRRKKIRCSGEKPACKHCLRSRIPCVYKVTTRKAAPRTDYMAMLDKRLRRMEDRIIKIVPKQEQDGMASSIPRASVKPTLPGAAPSTKGSSKKRGAEEAFGGGGPDLDSWAKAPVKTNLDSPTQPSAAFLLDASEESKFLQEGEDALPPKETQEHLADVFFDQVYGQAYHILHKPSYMRKLRNGDLPPVLILSVCAMAARHSTHPDFISSPLPAYYRGEEYARAAREIVLQRHDHPSITVLICLLILGLHDFAICHGRSSWSFGGQAIRMAFALQLHKDLEHDPLRPGVKLSFVDREIRRRTMWACLVMDRFNASGTDKPIFIKEETLKIPLPVKEKNFMLDMPAKTENLHGDVPGATDEVEKANARENMGVAAYLIKAISIWGRIMKYFNQGGREMDEKKAWEEDSAYMALVKEAEEMPDSLPETLKYSHDNLHVHDTESMANQFLFLHIVLQQNILYLNRFAAQAILPSSEADASDDTPQKPFITKAGAKAFSAAHRVSELLKDSELYSITAPFAGYCAYLSGTVHVFGLFSGSSTIEKPAKQNLAINIVFLNKLKRHWVVFELFQNHLRRLYRETADASKSGMPRNELPVILQYSDWFEHFPIGVASDLADPTTFKKKEKGEDAVLEQKTPLGTVEDLFASISPPNKDTSGRSNSMSSKRKAIASKRGSVTSRGSDHHNNNNNANLERLMTDVASEHLAHLPQQGGAYPGGVTLGGQTSAATSYAALTAVPHAGGYNTTLSPISPVAMAHAQFGAAHQHNPHGGLYPQDVMTLQQLGVAHNGMLTQTMMGGPYGGGHLDAATAAMIDGLPTTGWTGNENGAGRDSSRATAAGAAGADGPHNNPHHTVYGHGPTHNHNTNWFMPFAGMDQSEVGDVGLANSLDGFGSMFGPGTDGSSMGGTGAH